VESLEDLYEDLSVIHLAGSACTPLDGLLSWCREVATTVVLELKACEAVNRLAAERKAYFAAPEKQHTSGQLSFAAKMIAADCHHNDMTRLHECALSHYALMMSAVVVDGFAEDARFRGPGLSQPARVDKGKGKAHMSLENDIGDSLAKDEVVGSREECNNVNINMLG